MNEPGSGDQIGYIREKIGSINATLDALRKLIENRHEEAKEAEDDVQTLIGEVKRDITGIRERVGVLETNLLTVTTKVNGMQPVVEQVITLKQQGMAWAVVVGAIGTVISIFYQPILAALRSLVWPK